MPVVRAARIGFIGSRSRDGGDARLDVIRFCDGRLPREARP
jgi:hypothetical protein